MARRTSASIPLYQIIDQRAMARLPSKSMATERYFFLFLKQKTSYDFKAGMWKWKLEAEAVEAVNFLWKRKHFDGRGWKRKLTRKRKC